MECFRSDHWNGPVAGHTDIGQAMAARGGLRAFVTAGGIGARGYRARTGVAVGTLSSVIRKNQDMLRVLRPVEVEPCLAHPNISYRSIDMG
jgi:hypothetical protein